VPNIQLFWRIALLFRVINSIKHVMAGGYTSYLQYTHKMARTLPRHRGCGFPSAFCPALRAGHQAAVADGRPLIRSPVRLRREKCVRLKPATSIHDDNPKLSASRATASGLLRPLEISLSGAHIASRPSGSEMLRRKRRGQGPTHAAGRLSWPPALPKATFSSGFEIPSFSETSGPLKTTSLPPIVAESWTSGRRFRRSSTVRV